MKVKRAFILKHLLFSISILVSFASFGQSGCPTGALPKMGGPKDKVHAGGMLTADSIVQVPTDTLKSNCFPNTGNIAVKSGIFYYYTGTKYTSITASSDSTQFATVFDVDTAKANIRSEIPGNTDQLINGAGYVTGMNVSDSIIIKLDTTQSAFNAHLTQAIPTPGDILINNNGTPGALQANQTAVPMYVQSVNGVLSNAPISIPGYLTFYLHDTASGITNYKLMTNSLSVLSEQYVTATNPSDGQIIQRWVTQSGLPNLQFIPAGTYGVHYHAYRSGGDIDNPVQVYGEIYKRNTGGTETLLAMTEVSSPLTEDEEQYTIRVDKDIAVNLDRSDRLVLYIRATITTPDPALVVHVGYCGSTNARVELPTPAVDASNFVPYTGAVNDLDLGAHSFNADTVTTTTPLVYSPQLLDSIAAVRAAIPSITGKVNYTDTAGMLTPYLRKADTTAMLAPYLRKADTSTLSNRINAKLNTSDTTAMLAGYYRATNPNGYTSNTGTVTSVIAGVGMVTNTITATGTISNDTTNVMSTKAWRQKLADSIGANFLTPANTATVTNKNIHSRVLAAASYSLNVTMDWDTYDVYVDSSQATALLFNAPTSTNAAYDDVRRIYIRDNGTARALTWDAAFVAGTTVALPTTTTINRWLIIEFVRKPNKWFITGWADGYP